MTDYDRYLIGLIELPVCTPCCKEAEDMGADTHSSSDLMRMMGADMPNHLCDEVETAKEIKCSCECRKE